jgi:phosphosulfolactate synthase (CoM biosynthesis protein A)
MAANDSAVPGDKSLKQQQEDLADEILEILGIERLELEAPQYDQIRAAIAHYTITVCMERGAIS